MDDTPPTTDIDKIVDALLELANQTRETRILVSDLFSRYSEDGSSCEKREASIESTRLNLVELVQRLEQRDRGRKLDRLKFGAVLILIIGMGGASAFALAKDRIERSYFEKSIRLVAQDDGKYWCNKAKGQIIRDHSGTHGCAIVMKGYQSGDESPSN
ncbi:hypothetical protein RA27_22145 [Ruegeria sp. ANG-R]|uniref:hypothetical protein n=1 Tax=Ruegeria sp. ANG-R TaxID=1577903 RepID=UPI00057F9A8B|nr:hypothetical protein [Ruegeria sp. ANG-R]KIC36458.1 hypothetical protein RA27_22145 [Ruegeria sp. ANG-R]